MAHSLGWEAGKLGGYKAERLANNLAFQLPGLPASEHIYAFQLSSHIAS
jgi:hypothetical protein